jgi:uncharacterized protein YjbJ (UPF0337 family)
MDRQRRDGGLKKTAGTIKERAGQLIGSRHLDTGEWSREDRGTVGNGVGRAMDAVREVVNEEKE